MSKRDKRRKIPYKKIALILVIILASVFVLNEIIVGNISYIAKWKECGHVPIVVAPRSQIGFGAAQSVTFDVYETPDYFVPKKSVIGFKNKMFCTLNEAKQSILPVDNIIYH